MVLGPGNWSNMLIEATTNGTTGAVRNYADFGPTIAAEVMNTAREWAGQFTVVIGTTGTIHEFAQAKEVTPCSGVVIRQSGNKYGVLTAGHALRRDLNTSDSAGVTLLTPWRTRNGEVMMLPLPPRRCTVVGIDNETEIGPDIAIIPLEGGEMGTLDAWGITAYNLDKERWSEQDRARLGKNPWLLSIIHGVRCEASQIIGSHTDGKIGALAFVATNTRTDVVREKDGFDYLELPSEFTEYSHPTHWTKTPPGTAAKEIEQLFHKGVTKQVWGGTSGAGVWNVAIGSNETGHPDGVVLAELAGICFYANPDKGSIVAHSAKSITTIAATHIEKVGSVPRS
ncbi:hypothetical protein F4X33_16300 [Candidatus Poribacteria bacterium]|nr:hypothetical protein [Candidatus Poribacteria bacterium]